MITTAVKHFLNHLFGREKAEKDRTAEVREEETVTEIQRKIDETKRQIEETDRQLERLSKVDPAEISRSIVKSINTQTIREANIKRQQSTLGYGLKWKKPRPAHEKKTWDLKKKPEKN